MLYRPAAIMIKPEVIVREARRVESSLPRMNCKGLCQECCGPIGMTQFEWRRIVERLGREPVETKEMPLRASSGQTVARDAVITLPPGPNLECPMLKDGRCSVYDIRPMICRLWGMTRTMQCPHGCTPERWISDREGFELMDKMQKISEKAGV